MNLMEKSHFLQSQITPFNLHCHHLLWCFVVQGLMRKVGIVIVDPSFEIFLEFKREVPIVGPNQIFF